MDDFNLPDSTVSNFSVPDLVRVDLATPGFTLPDVTQPDPLLPDLTLPLIPNDLDLMSGECPDPASPDLTSPDIPASLSLPDATMHSSPNPHPAYMPEVTMEGRPGELSDSALLLLHMSPDFQRLPSEMEYSSLYIAADGMSARNRHLGKLELGLEDEERKQ